MVLTNSDSLGLVGLVRKVPSEVTETGDLAGT